MKEEGEDELRNVYTTSYSGQISPASKRSRKLTLEFHLTGLVVLLFSLDHVY